VEWRARVTDHLFLEAGATGRLRLRPETLLVEGVGPVLRLPTAWLILGGGVGWCFY